MFSKRWLALAISVVSLCLFAIAGLVAWPGGPGTFPARAAAVPGDCGFAWRVVPSPNAGSGNNYLNSVAVISSTDAWAVGYYVDASGGQQTLTMHWNGSSWAIVSSPNLGTENVLTGVSAVASNDVWAVGNYRASSAPLLYTLHWDGTSWTNIPNPNPGFNYAESLLAVDAVSQNDVWAVGFYRHFSPQALIMHWNGSSWDVSANPPGIVQLNAVTAIAANDVWTVGSDMSQTGFPSVTFHWNGSSWSAITTPDISTLYGVSGTASDNVWTVGVNGILRWNGSVWSQVSAPAVGTLRGVKAFSANEAWAVGGSILRWNGSAWSVYSTPPGTLNGINGPNSSEVWAVGSYLNGGVNQTLTMRYSDAGPCTSPTPTPTADVDLTGSVEWSSQCPVQTLRLTTHLDITPGFGIGATVMRLRNSNGAFQDFPVPPLNYHPDANTYTYDCTIGACVPSSWLSSMPLTLTVDATNQVAEINENNNDSHQSSQPPSACVPASLVGHVTWQGRPAPPDPLNQLPITLTLKSGANEYNWTGITTDASGYFTVTTAGLPLGSYNWRVKGPRFLANSGSWNLGEHVEMSTLRAGDANNDNIVNTADFTIVRNSFGRGLGDPTYDDRADFNGDRRITTADFSLLRGNFGRAGAPPLGPAR